MHRLGSMLALTLLSCCAGFIDAVRHYFAKYVLHDVRVREEADLDAAQLLQGLQAEAVGIAVAGARVERVASRQHHREHPLQQLRRCHLRAEVLELLLNDVSKQAVGSF